MGKGFRQFSYSQGQNKLVRAVQHGYIVQGWFLEDYIRDAIDNQGWESLLFWAPKGSFKSNLELQILYKMYGNWDKALKYNIASPLKYIEVMSEIGPRQRLPLLIWDDITRHLPSTLYFSNRPLYEAIKKYWPVTRSKFNTFMCSAPLKNDVLDFILSDMSGELFFDRRVAGSLTGRFDFQRHCWSIDFENPKKALFEMVRVEYSEFPMIPEIADEVYQKELDKAKAENRKPREKLPGVPKDIFKLYWEERMDLANTANEELMDAFQELMDKEAKDQTTSVAPTPYPNQQLRCNQCGYTWQRRTKEPKKCPNCGSRLIKNPN